MFYAGGSKKIWTGHKGKLSTVDDFYDRKWPVIFIAVQRIGSNKSYSGAGPRGQEPGSITQRMKETCGGKSLNKLCIQRVAKICGHAIRATYPWQMISLD